MLLTIFNVFSLHIMLLNMYNISISLINHWFQSICMTISYTLILANLHPTSYKMQCKISENHVCLVTNPFYLFLNNSYLRNISIFILCINYYVFVIAGKVYLDRGELSMYHLPLCILDRYL